MANTENVVTRLRRKNATSFDTPYFIGSKAQYVAGVRGTSVNNIEENMLLGYDTITTEEELEGGVTHIVKEYRTESATTNYYYIDIYQFNSYSAYKRWFYEDGLFLPEDINDNDYDSISQTLIGVDTSVYSFVGNDTFYMVNTEPPVVPIVTKATLHFINGSGTDISVAEKTIYGKVSESGKMVQRQVIRNLL